MDAADFSETYVAKKKKSLLDTKKGASHKGIIYELILHAPLYN